MLVGGGGGGWGGANNWSKNRIGKQASLQSFKLQNVVKKLKKKMRGLYNWMYFFYR